MSVAPKLGAQPAVVIGCVLVMEQPPTHQHEGGYLDQKNGDVGCRNLNDPSWKLGEGWDGVSSRNGGWQNYGVHAKKSITSEHCRADCVAYRLRVMGTAACTESRYSSDDVPLLGVDLSISISSDNVHSNRKSNQLTRFCENIYWL